MKYLRVFLLIAPLSLCAFARADVETLVCIRHGEKTPTELGQLTVRGLNRSLALPKVLVGRYGVPQYIFAPDPAKDLIGGGSGPLECYVRPLATIEPTAIMCGLPVDTDFGYLQTEGLESELLKPTYQNALVFIAWEHGMLAQFITQIATDAGGMPVAAISWPENDYDSIYVVRIEREDGRTTVTITHQHEGLNGLSTRFPGPAGLGNGAGAGQPSETSLQ
ncbi:MAG: histidine phosphatase family protein [Opitutaceae bacterium]